MNVKAKIQTADELAELVADFLQRPACELPRDTSLFECGLDSIQVMRIAGKLRSAGFDLTYGEMLRRPSLDAWWQSIKKSPSIVRPSVDKADVAFIDSSTFPLTPLQEAYLIGRHPSQAYGGVACHGYIELDGEGLEPERLRSSVILLLARHPMLRASFQENHTQTIGPVLESWTLRVHDLRQFSHADVRAALRQIRENLSHRLLEIEKGQVFDFQLSLLPAGRTRIHFNIDLLAADVRSVGIILRDLASIYEGERDYSTSPLNGFIEYCQAHSRPSAAKDRAAAYWNNQLAKLPGPPGLPIISNREEKKPRFVRHEFRVSKNDVEKIKIVCQRNSVTLASTLLSIFAEVLYFWSESPHFFINVPIFSRPVEYPGIDDVVGDFTNIVLVDVNISEAQPFESLNKTILSTLHDRIAHSDYPGVDVLRDLARQDPARNPLGAPQAPVVFACNLEIPFVDERCQRTLGKLGWMISQTPQVWLDHQVNILNDGGLLLNWDVLEGVFPGNVIDDMFALYEDIVRRIGDADWNEPLSLTLPQYQQNVRTAANATAGQLPIRALHELFFLTATNSPSNLAIATPNSRITYSELASLVKVHADQLLQNGVSPGDRVLVWLPKGIDQISYILAVLAIGGVFVPISAHTPADRVERIYRDCDARLLITSPGNALPNCRTLFPNADQLTIDSDISDAGRPWHRKTDPGSLAYIIYTSGSTGTPKGVMISHIAASNTILDLNARLAVSGTDRIFGISEIGFDLSVYDIFGAFSAGASLLLPDERSKREPREWAELIVAHHVTIWNSVPALMEMLLASFELDQKNPPTTLRAVLLSGDWIGLDLPPRLKSVAPSARLIALGGATEASIWSNWFEVETVEAHWTSIPYGRPLRNQTYRVLDSHLSDRPDWVPGDLYIGGLGLAQGYWGDANKTKAAFIRHSDGDALYRTGDVARYWPDGNIEFLGRKDAQVKIGGHRIELGEIEAILAGYQGIRHAFVAVDETPLGAKKLSAYIFEDRAKVGSIIRYPTRDDLDRYLSAQLPDYMLPDEYFIVDSVPLTGNGKLDRKKLDRSRPILSGNVPQKAFLNGAGQAIAQIWEEILQKEEIHPSENFFQVGGDSLLAVRMTARISAHVGRDVPVSQVFSHPKLGDYIDSVTPPDMRQE